MGDPARLHTLQDRLDLRGVVGNSIQSSVLQQAGIADADPLIACAPLDGTNRVVCRSYRSNPHTGTRCRPTVEGTLWQAALRAIEAQRRA